MSSDPIGGYILFPSILARADLIVITLKAMELAPDEFEVRLPEDEYPLFPEEGFPFRTEEPPERALSLLAQEKGGVIKGTGLKSGEIFWFEPVIASYQPIEVWAEERAMEYNKWPQEIDFFVTRWLQFCEQGQAIFGYFSPFYFKFAHDYLEEKILPAFLHGTARDFLKQIEPCWLVYLGRELTERWRLEQKPLYSPLLLSQDLPSGAHFFRTSLDLFDASSSILPP